jgi:molybdopterin converting factor small subunit
VAHEDEWYRPGMTDAPGTISVRLFAGLELRTRERRAAWDLDPVEAATVGAVTEAVGLEPGAAGLILVNGLHAGPDRVLCPGDEVALFPPLGGG